MSVFVLKAFRVGEDEDREPFAAFVLDEQTRDCLAPVVGAREWDSARIQGGGVANAVRSLALTSPPHILIVDLSESADPLADITALAEVCEPGTIVIALGEMNDVSLYRELMAAGIFDYLVKPVTADQLHNAIAAAEELEHVAPEAQAATTASGQLTTVIGVRGGVGASTVAVNSSWVLAHEFDRKVALIDLDIHFGSAALVFDLEPGRGLFDALENPGRVDGLFIERAMVKKSDKFSILSSEAPLGDPLDPNPTALNHLLDELRNNFDTVVFDLPRWLVGAQQFLLTESDRIVLVTDMSLIGVRDTIRLLAFAKDIAPNTPVTVVANNVYGNARDEVSKRNFENAIERKIDWAIVADPKPVKAAAKAGKALPELAAGSKVTKAIRELSIDLLGEEAPTKKPTFWRWGKTEA